MKYIKRVIDKEIDELSKAFGAIQIVGPKGCGKTRTAKERSKTWIEFEDEEIRSSHLALANSSPNSFLKLELPILFDEWQDAPKIWGMVRKACDDKRRFGDFYLTGSSSKDIKTPHTGTGRIATLEMLPMSLYETKDSNGKISLKDLFDRKIDINGIKSKLTVEELLYVACRGGWPSTLEIDDKMAKLKFAKSLFNQICKVDISHFDDVKRNPIIAKTILKSYARNIGTLAKKKTIYADVSSAFQVSENTFDDYLDVLKRLYVIRDYEAWCPQIRSAKSLRAPIKHMFVDPSIAIAALHLSPDYFLTDFDYFGHIFESLVFRDLTVYSTALDGELSHYHDMFDLEVDAVLHLGDGRYALIEIKLGDTDIDQGIKNMKKVKDLIKKHNREKDSIRIREPDLMIVITGGPVAYEKDDAYVIPIGCLKD